MKKATLFAVVFVLVASLGLQIPVNAESKIVCTNTNPPKGREEAQKNGEAFGRVVELRESYKNDGEIDKILIDTINENIKIGCSTQELELLMVELTKTAEEIKAKRIEDAKAAENDKNAANNTDKAVDNSTAVDPKADDNKDADKKAEADNKDAADVKADDAEAKKDVKPEEAKEIIAEVKEDKKSDIKMEPTTVVAPNTGVGYSNTVFYLLVSGIILAGATYFAVKKA